MKNTITTRVMILGFRFPKQLSLTEKGANAATHRKRSAPPPKERSVPNFERSTTYIRRHGLLVQPIANGLLVQPIATPASSFNQLPPRPPRSTATRPPRSTICQRPPRSTICQRPPRSTIATASSFNQLPTAPPGLLGQLYDYSTTTPIGLLVQMRKTASSFNQLPGLLVQPIAKRPPRSTATRPPRSTICQRPPRSTMPRPPRSTIASAHHTASSFNIQDLPKLATKAFRPRHTSEILGPVPLKQFHVLKLRGETMPLHIPQEPPSGMLRNKVGLSAPPKQPIIGRALVTRNLHHPKGTDFHESQRHFLRTTSWREEQAGGVFRSAFHGLPGPQKNVSRRFCGQYARVFFFGFVNDPSAGSPTETLLRLLLPLNDQV